MARRALHCDLHRSCGRLLAPPIHEVDPAAIAPAQQLAAEEAWLPGEEAVLQGLRGVEQGGFVHPLRQLEGGPFEAAELDVSVRSVFRDIELLRGRGYPIDAARGRGGGLRLHASWGLGRVLLSREEARCTLLSLAVTERLGFPMFAGDVSRARKKIVDAFPAAERRRIGPLRERVFVGPNASAAVRGSYGVPAAGPMRGLQAAFVAERTVVAEHEKQGGERLVRRMEPHALLINWPAWYLLAFDHLRGQPRTFQLDRFLRVDVEAATFRPRPFDVSRVLLAGTGVPVRGV